MARTAPTGVTTLWPHAPGDAVPWGPPDVDRGIHAGPEIKVTSPGYRGSSAAICGLSRSRTSEYGTVTV
ncbi:hypothetical protein GCM10023196_090640 [Actinoallomurus vinaceus]|uniref:Uncharacterized protein n=1 Tax=Actinoallomurus vinaceus TaxID=1080074 RepID=A0ABP8UST1_9ACTN